MAKQFRAAFECENDGTQTLEDIALILRMIARQIAAGIADTGFYETIRDENGNRIGQFRIKDEDAESGRY